MKIRVGFVTNSSSSNFILIFDKFPDSCFSLRYMLFGDEKFVKDEFDEDNPVYYPTDKIAEVIWKDIVNYRLKNKEPDTSILYDLALQYVMNNTDFYDKYKYMLDFHNRSTYDDFYNLLSIEANKVLEEWLKLFTNKEICILEYSDNKDYNSIPGYVFEHFDLFRNIDYIRISFH